MSCSIRLNNLKKVLAVATVIATISGLAPDSVQAEEVCPRGKICISGISNSPGIDIVSFGINPVTDSNPSRTVGIFEGAIENFQIRLVTDQEELTLPPLQSGKITASKLIGNNDLALAQFWLTIDNLINESNLSAQKFENGGVKYEATFDGGSVNFTFFVPLPDPGMNFDLINSLSDLERYLQTSTFELPGVLQAFHPEIDDRKFVQGYGLSCRTNQGIPTPAPDVPDNTNLSDLCDKFSLDSGGERLKIKFGPNTKVPDPNATTSLLGIGVLGVGSLIKRNKRSKKIAESQLALSE